MRRLYHHRNDPYSSFYGSAPMNYDDGFHHRLLNLIIEKASKVDFYNRLKEEAPNEKEKKYLLQILEDENRLLNHLTDLYCSQTGRKPVYQINLTHFHSYSDGLSHAFIDELRDYDMYRNLYFQSPFPQMGNLFFLAFTNHIKHATLLNHLLSMKEKKQSTPLELKDYGPEPLVIDIHEATMENKHFRTALWTGKHLQLTLMSIEVGGEIGLEMHPNVDQFLRIESGRAIVKMGDSKEKLDFVKHVEDDSIILVPAGKWHNVINQGDKPLKVYSLYAPPNHPRGTIHHTMEEAEENHP